MRVWVPSGYTDSYKNAEVPMGLQNVVKVAAGGFHSVALKSDGTIVNWGSNASSRRIPTNYGGVVDIAAGKYQVLALKGDGTVVGWGIGAPFDDGVDPPSGLTGVTAIAAGDQFSVALKSDGTLVGWGENLNGHGRLVPAGLQNVVAISAGGTQGLALKKDGAVAAFAWGDTSSRSPRTVPAGLTDVVAISSSVTTSVALKGDGTVVTWDRSGAYSNGLTRVRAVSALVFGGVALLGPSITMHRLPVGMGAQANAADPTYKKIVPTSDVVILKTLPKIEGGLVADGVAPLIFAAERLKPGTKYTLKLYRRNSQGKPVGAELLSGRLHFLDNTGRWQKGSEFTPSEGRVYCYLEGIDSEEDSLDLKSKSEFPLVARISEVTTTESATADCPFGIRKPPVVLVHGYNTTGEWESNFLAELAPTHAGTSSDPADNFVRTIRYGVIGENTDGNKFGSLPDLAGILSDVLMREVETEGSAAGWRKRWAYTRYDVVAHSQGGVLARMLSSQIANGKVPAFRNETNFFRGRFNRVVTIGSPHNGSRLVRYMFGLLSTNNFFDLVTGGLPTRGRIVGLIKHVVPNVLFQLPDWTDQGDWTDWTGVQNLSGTLQSKFDPFGPQIIHLNKAGSVWTPDPTARFHFIVTSVDYRGSAATALGVPAYLALGLTPLSGYQAVLPQGSDGVVDTLSQSAGLPLGHLQTSSVTSPRTSHSKPTGLFGAEGEFDYDVNSSAVAIKVRTALDENSSWSFGPFPTLRPLGPAEEAKIDDAAGAQPIAVQELIQSLEGGAELRSTHSGAMLFAPAISEGYRFHFSQAASLPPATTVQWMAEVIGTNGASQEGVTITSNLENPDEVTVNVAPEVAGDVILYASYISTNGTLVASKPVLVTSRPFVEAQVGLAFQRAEVTLVQGNSLWPELFSTYEGGLRKWEFISPDTILDAVSSDESVLGVDPVGLEITAKDPGTATLTVRRGGYTAEMKVTVVLPPGTIGFSAPLFTASEQNGVATIAVVRTGGSGGGASVEYAVNPGTARAGADYTPVSGTLIFAEGEMMKSFQIPIAQDGLFELDENLQLRLHTNGGGAVLGLDEATLTIESAESFTPAKGTYSGLALITDAEPTHGHTGSLNFTLGVRGGFAGKLRFGGKSYALRGQFDTEGKATVVVRRTGATPLTVTLQMDDGTDVLRGTISDGDVMIGIAVERRTFHARDNPAPQAGTYTALLPANEDAKSPDVPQGTGYATLKITAAGSCLVRGRLADATPLTVNVPLSKEGLMRLYVPLYQRRGFLAGTLSFGDAPASSAGGLLHWIRPSTPKSALFPNGFTSYADVTLGRYSPPLPGLPPLSEMNDTYGKALLTFQGDYLEGTLNASFTWPDRKEGVLSKVFGSSKTGLFSGKFIPSTGARAVPFAGVIVQDKSMGEGYFLKDGRSMKVTLEPVQ